MYLKNILLDIADLRMQDANKLGKLQQRKTSLNYLIVKSSIFGIAINVIFIDKNIAKAERTPKELLG